MFQSLVSLWLALLSAALLTGALPADNESTVSGPGPEAAVSVAPEAGRLTDHAVSGDVFEALLAARTEAAEPLLREPALDGMPLLQDKGSGLWYYSLPEGSADRTDPVLSYTGGSAGLRLAVFGGITGETLRNGEPVRLLAYDNESYSLYEIVCTTLPLLDISASKEIGDENVAVQLRLYDNREEARTRLLELQGKMRVRGQSTRRFPKKGYKLTLTHPQADGSLANTNAALLGLRSDDDWLLYAGYNDQEKLRNVFSCQLWKESCAWDNSFQLNNGTEYRYVELFLNGRYHGLYALGYPIDAKQMHLGKTAFGPTEEFLYKKISWFAESKMSFSGGGRVSGYRLKDFTSEKISTAWAALRDYYRVLFRESQTAPAALRDRLDLPNAIDVHLFFFLIQGSDNTNVGLKNVYMTQKQLGERRVMLYTPWDMDFSWGNQFVKGNATKTRMYGFTPEDNFTWADSPIQKLLDAGDEDILEQVKAQYAQLRRNAWSDGSVLTMLDRFEEAIFASGAYGRDQARWPDGNYLEDSADGLALFRQFVLDRLAYMDGYIADLSA